jgi:hypothetical protein
MKPFYQELTAENVLQGRPDCHSLPDEVTIS